MQHPPAQREQTIETYVAERTIRQLAVPLVLQPGDLARGLVVEDLDLAVDGLLLLDALDHVPGAEIHGDGVPGRGDFVVEALDLAEDGFETVPVRW